VTAISVNEFHYIKIETFNPHSFSRNGSDTGRNTFIKHRRMRFEIYARKNGGSDTLDK
jgi:hypothetical protein